MRIMNINLLNELPVNETFISLDTKGNMNIEGFKKLIDYSASKIQLLTNSKMVYIYGENLEILSCTKHSASVVGKIHKIEIFEVSDA